MMRAYAFLAREMCRIDPGLRHAFNLEFDKLKAIFKKRGRPFPRDVEIISEEFNFEQRASQELLLSFKPFEGDHLERILDE